MSKPSDWTVRDDRRKRALLRAFGHVNGLPADFYYTSKNGLMKQKPYDVLCDEQRAVVVYEGCDRYRAKELLRADELYWTKRREAGANIAAAVREELKGSTESFAHPADSVGVGIDFEHYVMHEPGADDFDHDAYWSLRGMGQ